MSTSLLIDVALCSWRLRPYPIERDHDIEAVGLNGVNRSDARAQ